MIVIRRLAGCLICELVWNNENAQSKIGEISDDFTPVSGAVSINMRFPSRLQISGAPIFNSFQIVQLFETLRDPQAIKKLTHSSGKYWSFPKYQERNPG